MVDFSASSSSESVTAYQFVLGDKVVTRPETLLSGQNLAKNVVVGRVTKGAATAAKQSGTGDGTIGSVTLGAAAKVGVYVLTCTSAAANAGTFQVEDPDGDLLKPLTVGVAYASSQINLTVADGSTDWGVGAVIYVTVSEGSGKIKKCVKTATDGSEKPIGILLSGVDATSADKKAVIYVAGEFNFSEVVFDSSFDTDFKKNSAFDRSPIVLKKLVYSIG